MPTVTGFSKQVKIVSFAPLFDMEQLHDDKVLLPNELIVDDIGMPLSKVETASLIGLAVDYLSRGVYTGNMEQAFDISLHGAGCASYQILNDCISDAKDLLSHINGLDDESIIKAINIVQYDQFYRNPLYAKYRELTPNADTISNIRTMAERTIKYYESEKVVIFGETYHGAYTRNVCNGDMDCRSSSNLIDLKTSKYPPKPEHFIQLATYYILGLHSNAADYVNISKLTAYNPRLDTITFWNIDMKEPKLSALERLMGYPKDRRIFR